MTDALYLLPDVREVVRRRKALPAGTFLEAWPDLRLAGHVWVGASAKALLDSAGEPVVSLLAVEASAVRIYYGPRLAHIEGLPAEESLRGRILSAHGIAAAWVTLDRFGQPMQYQPQSPADAMFVLRRPRTDVGHLWRLFQTKDDAQTFLRNYYGNDPEAQTWATELPVDTYAELIERHRQ
jgi:hypothetical protein